MSDLLKKIGLLEQEVSQLTEERRFAMTTLEIAANLLTFDSRPAEQTDREQTIYETASKILSLLNFEGICFYLINEEDASFSPKYCEPAELQPQFELMVDDLIEDQTFAWALGRNKAVRVEIDNSQHTLLLHSLTTASRTRGMFLGLQCEGDDEFDPPLPLLTVILHSCANILESFDLYHHMRQINRNLELNVSKLEKVEQEKNLAVASLKSKIEKIASDLNKETEQLISTKLNTDQTRCAITIKKNINQMLDEVNQSTSVTDSKPVP